jgi:exonuclease III
MRENRIGIMAIQETHLTDDLAEEFNTLFGGKLSLIHSPDPLTRNARGVALILNKRFINTTEAATTVLVPGRAILTMIPWHDDQTLKILAVYSPNAPGEIKEFWKTIKDKVTQNANLKPNIMLGDFNLVEDAIDRLPCKADELSATNALRDFKINNNLIDGWRTAHPEEKGYTWLRESDGTQSRLDRIYTHKEFFNDCNEWNINQPPIPTDHDMVSVEFSTPSAPEIGKGRWAIPSRLFKNKKIKDDIQKLSLKLEADLKIPTSRSPLRNPQTLLGNFKIKVINTMRAHERVTQPIIKMRISKLYDKLKDIRNNASLPQDEIKIASTQIKKEISALIKDTHQYNRDKLAAIDDAEGERVGKTWSSRHKESKPRDTIKRLQELNSETSTRDSKRMAKIAAEHHYNIQFVDHHPLSQPDKPKLDAILNLVKAKLTEDSKDKLRAPITEDETRNAIKKTANDKAPGIDGIPIEFWKSLDDQHAAANKDDALKRKCNIVWVLTQVFRDIEEFGMDANAKINEGCVSPIYKKKNPEIIANYRPITLLNTDYKILTKALSIRLAAVAHEVINTDQAGFVKGRSIFDQVKTTKLVIDYMEKTNKLGTVVALDQEKAYDKILHPYLWEVLRKFNFPEEFIRTIKSLYLNATSTVMINGEISIPFKILRGVRQGDALSCLLFNIAIEPLAENIRRSRLIAGIPIPGTRKSLKVKLFADDTTVFLSETDNVKDLHQILNNWCEVSGAKFNIEKTEIIPLGNPTQRSEIIASRKLSAESEEFPTHVHLAREGEPVRILGAWLGNNVDQATTWTPLIENIHKRLKRWGAARHSLEGRRLIIQMQVAGVTQYLTKVQGMPKDVELELNTLCRKFMWNFEKVDSINQKQMCATHKKGGKKLVNIETRNKAIHLTWLKSYLNLGNDRATWAYFADAIICTDIPDYQQIDKDPESRVMPIVQSWETKTRNSTLPEDLKTMMKIAKEYNVQIAAPNPSPEAKEDLPLWYHVHSVPAARKLYKTKPAKCLRKNHGVILVKDATQILDRTPDDHVNRINCKCVNCIHMRRNEKCTHPNTCINTTAQLLKHIQPNWNPRPDTPPNIPSQVTDEATQNETRTFDRSNQTDTLREAIVIFGDRHQTPTPLNTLPANPTTPRYETVYTDGACINNGDEDAAAGLGIWYGENDPRNTGMRVPSKSQSNQSGELFAILIAVKNQPPQDNLLIASDS